MKVALGMVLSIFFLLALLRLVLGGILLHKLGLVLVYLCLATWLALCGILKAALLDAWRSKVAADLCDRRGVRGGPLLDVHGSLQLLLLMSGKEIRLSFGVSLLGVFGMGSPWYG